MKKQWFISSVLTITFGGLLYILFRSESLKMFGWLRTLFGTEVVKSMRAFTLEFADVIPDWMLYSLPDGLWLSSYISMMLIVWKNKINSENRFWVFSMPIAAVLSEAGQFFKIIPGTFDWMDVVMYLLGTVFPLAIYLKTRTDNFK